MRCTYFFFEGIFRDDHPEFGAKKLFSSAMVPCSNEEKAHEILVSELAEHGIRIVEIEDQFVFDPEKVDFQDPDNVEWVSLYEEVRRFNTTIFTPWHLFDE